MLLRGYLEGLKQGIAATPEKTTKYIAVCRQKSDQLERLVSDLFTFTKMEYMEQIVLREELDFTEVMEHSLDGILPTADEKSVAVAVERPTDRFPWLEMHTY